MLHIYTFLYVAAITIMALGLWVPAIVCAAAASGLAFRGTRFRASAPVVTREEAG